MVKIYYILLLIISLLLFSKCGSNHKKKERENHSSGKELKQIVYGFDNPPTFRKDGELNFLDIKNEKLFHLEIEIVNTEIERARGLMYRPEMAENKGMLFIMESEDYQSFYMRNTIIPLDIIYINGNYEIVDIYKNTIILDETSLPSAKPARFVVEINAGLCNKFNIKIGDKIELL